jgi:hypothetical protein
MAAPVKTKTWTKYSTYIVAGSGPTPQVGQTQANSDSRLAFYRLKTTFLAAGWTIVSSCGYYDAGGGAAWNYGAADHWPDAASVRWKEVGDKFGWIVLKNTNLHAVGNGFQVLIALTNDRNYTAVGTLAFSCEGGFSDGTELVRPTAVDEALIYNNTSWTGASNGDFSATAINIWYPSDGTSFRVWWGKTPLTSTHVNPMWFFEKLVDTPDWLDKPVIAGATYVQTESTMYATAGTNLKFSAVGYNGQSVGLTTESNQSGVLVNHAAVQQVDMGGRWPVFPISAVSTSILARGYLGRISDLWAVPEAIAIGDYMPSTGEKDFVVMPNILMPNDGTLIQLP